MPLYFSYEPDREDFILHPTEDAARKYTKECFDSFQKFLKDYPDYKMHGDEHKLCWGQVIEKVHIEPDGWKLKQVEE